MASNIIGLAEIVDGSCTEELETLRCNNNNKTLHWNGGLEKRHIYSRIWAIIIAHKLKLRRSNPIVLLVFAVAAVKAKATTEAE